MTVCRLHSFRGQYILHVGVGNAVEAEPLLRGSNILIRMRSGDEKFVRSLLDNGIPHHNAVIYGDITRELEEFTRLMNIPVVVCT